MIDISGLYGKDACDLVCKIDAFLEKSLEHRSFGKGVYVEDSGFMMIDIKDHGAFYVKFPNTPPIALAAIDMNSGEYIFKSTEIGGRKLNIYDLDGFSIERLIKRAEHEWSMDMQGKF
jgi:hypothetical protein